MKPNEFRRRADRSLSALTWDEADAGRVMQAISTEEKQVKKVSFTFVLIAAVVLLGMAALAERILFPDFFDKAFGRGVSGQEPYTVEYGAGEGGLAKTEHYPLIERVDVDAETAQALLGGYIFSEGGAVSVDGYTFTLENAVIDQNGAGVLLVKIENPNGHGLRRSWNEYSDDVVPAHVQVSRKSGDYPYMDDQAHVALDSFTDTEMEYVIYTAPLEVLPEDETLSLECSVIRRAGEEYEVSSEMIPVAVSARVPAQEYKADGVRVSLSPLGMMIRYDFVPEREKILERLAVRFDDGSEYTVIGDDVVNTAVHSVEYGSWNEWITFNRLVDPARVTGIALEAQAQDDTGENTYTLNVVLTTQD